MTIEEAINQIIDSLMGEKANLLNHSDRVALTDALNTMRKYQKIEQIIEDWESDKGWALEMSELYWLDRIKEVVEDDRN